MKELVKTYCPEDYAIFIQGGLSSQPETVNMETDEEDDKDKDEEEQIEKGVDSVAAAGSV